MPRCRDQQLYFRTDFPLLVYLGYKRWRCLESYKYNIRYRFYRFTSSSITKPSDFTSLVWCWETRKWNEKNLSMLSARRKPSNICRMNSITCYPRRTYYNIMSIASNIGSPLRVNRCNWIPKPTEMPSYPYEPGCESRTDSLLTPGMDNTRHFYSITAVAGIVWTQTIPRSNSGTSIRTYSSSATLVPMFQPERDLTAAGTLTVLR